MESRNENNDKSKFREKIEGGGAKHHESRNVLLDIISPYHLFYERLTGIHHFPYISTNICVLALPDIDTYYSNTRGIYVIGGDRKAVKV